MPTPHRKPLEPGNQTQDLLAGCSWSVIFVDLDAHNRNRQTLCSLLPRESRSHNTDAALLPTISYPAFAVDDDALCSQTLDKIVRKLRGKYGFKRFIRDGYRTTNEDKERRYYKPAEMKLFDGIECEFPIFFIFMMIDGVFRGNRAQVKEYQDLLEPVIFQSYEGHAVVPKYYYVPADFVEAEQNQHGSQKRFPSNSGRDGKLFLWGQALFNIAKLLVDELISPKDIDPIHRYVPGQDQRNVSMRYSNQGPIENDVVVHVALVAESQRLQVFLNTYGIQTQTPQQVEPIQIWPQKELVKAYRFLAVNKKLGLSGRPDRPVGCIGTSKIYRILGKTVVCYPIVFDLSDFYLSQDVMLLIDDIKVGRRPPSCMGQLQVLSRIVSSRNWTVRHRVQAAPIKEAGDADFLCPSCQDESCGRVASKAAQFAPQMPFISPNHGPADDGLDLKSASKDRHHSTEHIPIRARDGIPRLWYKSTTNATASVHVNMFRYDDGISCASRCDIPVTPHYLVRLILDWSRLGANAIIATS
ncbi:phosphorylase b kinase regulatory subunit beta-like [Entelurus aequoreus]|uniref:phosphorylase b kinase regulatory subunit beta-like n=1 Tax=Entelurus aequoreus TaxID=161455 RepID=UPI002B1E0845|nr:phosphorylase b kinase regulatory subunit beta-like [Entelurus aequoreus]